MSLIRTQKKTKLLKKTRKHRGGVGPNIKLLTGVKQNNKKIIIEAISEGADINYVYGFNGTVLGIAVENNNVEIIEVLLQNGADPNIPDKYDYTPLYDAVINNNEDLVSLLLEHNANPNIIVNDETILTTACRVGNPRIIYMLIRYRVEINKINNNGLTGLMVACIYGHPLVVGALLEGGADPNIITIENRTAIIYAVSSFEEIEIEKRTYIVKQLLHYNADPNISTTYRYTVYMIACLNGYIDIVMILFKNKKYDIDFNAISNDGLTGFMIAVSRGYLYLVKYLYEYIKNNIKNDSININEQNNYGQTALMLAVNNEYVELINYLLRIPNIKLNIEDVQGKNVIDYAELLQRYDIKKILINHSLKESQLLVINDVKIQQSRKKDPLKELKELKEENNEKWFKHSNVVTLEDENLCEYIRNDTNNLLFIFGKQISFINRQQLYKIFDDFVDNASKIYYKCKNIDNVALVPRLENVIMIPYLNMHMFALLGAMIPLEQLKKVITSKNQVYLVEQKKDTANINPVTSLNSIIGEDVSSGMHCQEDIPIKECDISFISNEVFMKECNSAK